MFISADEFGIELTQLGPGVGGCELPVDRSGGRVSVALPGRNLLRQSLWIVDSPSQTLSPQHAEFAFGDIQPPAVLGRVVNVEPLRHSPWPTAPPPRQGTTDSPDAYWRTRYMTHQPSRRSLKLLLPTISGVSEPGDRRLQSSDNPPRRWGGFSPPHLAWATLSIIIHSRSHQSVN